MNGDFNHRRHLEHVFRVGRAHMLGSVLGNNGIEGGDLYGAVFNHGGIARNNHALVGGIGVAGNIGLNERMLAFNFKTNPGIGAQIFQLQPCRQTMKVNAPVHAHKVHRGYVRETIFTQRGKVPDLNSIKQGINLFAVNGCSFIRSCMVPPE